MKNKSIKKLLCILAGMIILFTMMSGFSCVERWSRGIMTPVSVLGKVEWSITKINNGFIFMLILGIFELLLLLKSFFRKQKISIVIAAIRTLVTLWIPYIVLDGSAFETIATDIEIRYKITPIGGIVVSLSWFILILEIILDSLIQKSQSKVVNQGFIE